MYIPLQITSPTNADVNVNDKVSVGANFGLAQAQAFAPLVSSTLEFPTIWTYVTSVLNVSLQLFDFADDYMSGAWGITIVHLIKLVAIGVILGYSIYSMAMGYKTRPLGIKFDMGLHIFSIIVTVGLIISNFVVVFGKNKKNKSRYARFALLGAKIVIFSILLFKDFKAWSSGESQYAYVNETMTMGLSIVSAAISIFAIVNAQFNIVKV